LGCETPSDSFERTNSNDPLSQTYQGGTVTGLEAIADSSGIITLKWPEPNGVVTKHVIEKSLGDSLNFQPISELDSDVLQFSDSTREVRKQTYYRLSSFIEIEGEDDILYGRSKTMLEFGVIQPDSFEYLTDSKSLELSWRTDVPFFTHFIITSQNVLTEEQEYSVRIPAGQTKHTFIDPLLDIDFETRNYTIKGILKNNELEETINEEEISFSPDFFFRPRNVKINFLDEKNWEITWDNTPFFATEVEIVRSYENQYGSFEFEFNKLPDGNGSYVDSLIIENTSDEYLANRFRKYQLRFLNRSTGNSSRTSTVYAVLDVEPRINYESSISQNNPNSFTLNWDVIGADGDKVAEFIIEKENPNDPGTFQEIGRVNGDATFQYTDTNVSELDDPNYRVRTIVSRPSNTLKLTYSSDYQLDYSFETGMNNVTSIEAGIDKKYLAAVSFRSDGDNYFYTGIENPILITDIELKQKIAEIKVPSESISGFHISPDYKFIYFAVPTEGSIYKADFPSGNNLEKIIDDAFLSSGANFSGVYHIDVSSDGSFIIGTGGRGFVKRWDLNTSETDFVFAEYNTPTRYTYKNIAISPDGNIIAGNNGLSYIMDSDNGSVQYFEQWTPANLTDLQFSADGNFYSFSTFSNTEVYSTANWERVQRLFPGSRSDFHPERSRLLLSNYEWTYTYDLETQSIIDIISDQNGDQPQTSTGNKITYLDDDKIATVAGTGTIQIWKKRDTPRRWKRAF
jgi:hypothetical protein